MKKRSLRLDGHATSVSPEDVFWRHLRRIADEKEISIQKLVTEIDRRQPGNLSSALRLLVLEDLEKYLPDPKTPMGTMP